MDPGHWSTAATTDEECTIELIKSLYVEFGYQAVSW